MWNITLLQNGINLIIDRSQVVSIFPMKANDRKEERNRCCLSLSFSLHNFHFSPDIFHFWDLHIFLKQGGRMWMMVPLIERKESVKKRRWKNQDSIVLSFLPSCLLFVLAQLNLSHLTPHLSKVSSLSLSISWESFPLLLPLSYSSTFHFSFSLDTSSLLVRMEKWSEGSYEYQKPKILQIDRI